MDEESGESLGEEKDRYRKR